MSEVASQSNPLRAFVRGTWILLLVQLTVAMAVFGALTYASRQLTLILDETTEKQAKLEELEGTIEKLNRSIGELDQRLRNAHAATPIVRQAIILFHNRRYTEAIKQYQEALARDSENPYVHDLLSYSQYMAGRDAQGSGDSETSARLFEAAVMSVRRVLKEIPDYIDGYVELAIYECVRDQQDAAVAAYEAALARSSQARDYFVSRIGEIPQRCSALRTRLAAS
jgi:tetratricopeptide (TPR) repeat protein